MTQSLDIGNLLAASLLILFVVGASHALGLNLEWKIAIAAIRAAVQVRHLAFVLTEAPNTPAQHAVLMRFCLFVLSYSGAARGPGLLPTGADL